MFVHEKFWESGLVSRSKSVCCFVLGKTCSAWGFGYWKMIHNLSEICQSGLYRCIIIGLSAIHFTYSVLYLFRSVIFCHETCLSTDILPLMIPTHFTFCWQKHDSFHSGKMKSFRSVRFICSHIQYCGKVLGMCKEMLSNLAYRAGNSNALNKVSI